VRPDKSYIITAVTGATSDPFFVRLGGWLFPRRTWIPLPLIAALLLIPSEALPAWWTALGALCVAAGEALRIEGVRQIGVISRTRSDRLGPLVDTGPFARVRNPLYLGNIALWVGFSLIARLPWLAPVFLALLLFEYHAIVCWEERLLASRIGAPYRDYMSRVPRWIPTGQNARRSRPANAPDFEGQGLRTFTWGETFFSERGTLIAIVLGCLLLWMKSKF
jgi:protein-S-isoprenylcysteine O-methyltransferase Ste14